MSGIAKFFWSLVGTIGGRSFGAGSFQEARGEAAIEGVGAMPEQLVVPVEDYITVYDFTRDGDFTAFGLEIITEDGYLEIGIYTDAPTSATNDTAAGTAPRWCWLSASDLMPFLLSSPLVRTTLTANIGDWYGISGGEPILPTSSNAVGGRIYKIIAHNRDEDVEVTVERFQTK